MLKQDKTVTTDLVLTLEERMQALGWSKVIFEKENENEGEGQAVLPNC